MPLNLFIDTNVLLNFYHFSGEDLEELKKLTALIDKGDIALWLPKQVCDEFERNRDAKIKDAMAGTTQKFSMTAPAFFRNYQEFNDLQATIKAAGKQHARLLAVVKADMEKYELAADLTIKTLFDKAKVIDRTSAIFGRALERFRVGNPPGKKKDTIGDEINWESLLEAVPSNADLHMVSVDGDYGSQLIGAAPHRFLAGEYKAKKKGELHLYPSLQSFFAKHYPQIKLASDIAKVKAIDELAKSRSFSDTHVAVAGLEPFKADLNAQDIQTLVDIAETNNQVGWIVGDADVFALYHALSESKEIGAELKGRITDLLPNDEPEEGAEGDIPF